MGGWGEFSVPVWPAGQEVMLGGPGGDRAGAEGEMVKPRGRRRGDCERNTRCLIEELVSQQLMGCFCRELQGNLSCWFPG